ncbi:MAG: hypothetical protein KDA85_12150, partial [Planctomycetaceae bacterium]|nr:hypothetical protein [Planctomycetaceae bacterium]
MSLPDSTDSSFTFGDSAGPPFRGIRRLGDCQRWADVVIWNGVARWVEVAADLCQPFDLQVTQVLQQIDETLTQL